jgi:predicted component of type VI protein secretion system
MTQDVLLDIQVEGFVDVFQARDTDLLYSHTEVASPSFVSLLKQAKMIIRQRLVRTGKIGRYD